MNSRRLARLMEIISDIKAHPRLDPDDMVKRLDISRRQFYKDRDSLSELGFNFHYSRKRSGFVLDKELVFPAGSMSLSGLFSLMLAVSRLNGPHDFPLALAALQGLKNSMAQLPDELASLFQDALNQIVFEEGFKCPPQVLQEILEALAQKQIVLLQKKRRGRGPANPGGATAFGFQKPGPARGRHWRPGKGTPIVRAGQGAPGAAHGFGPPAALPRLNHRCIGPGFGLQIPITGTCFVYFPQNRSPGT